MITIMCNPKGSWECHLHELFFTRATTSCNTRNELAGVKNQGILVERLGK